MSGTAPEAKLLLDQLQNEVNRVLEQTGRLFAASRAHGPVPPVAQAARLKQALPDCIDKFHSALDELEDELQTAKAVLRRDLAAIREQDGSAQPTNDIPDVQPAEETKPDTIMTDDAQATEDTSKDVEMLDEPPKQPEAESTQQPSPKSMPEPEPNTSTDTNPPPEPTDPKPLSIDTTSKPLPKPTTEDPPPDTGTLSNNADLDSLFGGSASASATNEPGTTTDPFSSTNDADNFDFDAFTSELTQNGNGQGNVTDNDNIAALLPGLQDYANTAGTGDGGEGSGDPEFDAIFGDNSNDGQNDGVDGGADDIFGDLLADFPTGGEYNNENQDQEFDFGFS